MNQLFLASPEFLDNIKFEQNYIDEDKLPPKQPLHNFNTPRKIQSPHDHLYTSIEEVVTDSEANEAKKGLKSKYWGFLSKEMTKLPKQSNIPPLKIINHRINIFKAKFDAPDLGIDKILNIGADSINNKIKAPTANLNQIKVKKEGNLISKIKESEKTVQSKDSFDLSEFGNSNDAKSGIMFYSFKNKMNLKNKRQREKIRIQNQLQANKLKDLETTKPDNLDTQISSFITQEVVKPSRISSAKTSQLNSTEKIKKEQIRFKPIEKKSNSNIFERLTKDLSSPINKEDLSKKRIFISNIAEEIDKDLKEFGDTDAFKKIAYGKFRQFKKDFKDKINKHKIFPPEIIKFTRNKINENNLYLPNFDLVPSGVDKESIFIGINDYFKSSDDLKESIEVERWQKMNKILKGNMINFWNNTKDSNQ